jgi:3-oxoacyl-[acyl-carrier protein] reductase
MIQIDLSGKTAIVTGGGQGLGAAICQMLNRAGANVVVNYFGDSVGLNQKRAAEVVAKLDEHVVAMEADVRSVEQVKLMLEETISHFGALDIVVNNAAVLRDRTIKNMTYDEWNLVIDTNLGGVFNVCKESVPRLAEGGRIVNLGSISGTIGFFGQSNYSAAKAGVAGLTKVLSKELAKRKITVNAVASGVVLTEMGRSIPERIRARMLDSIPLGRFGEADEIAAVVTFLCSDFASYITGQVIHVNGGWIG